MVIGLVKGFLIIYVVFAIFSAFSPVFLETGIIGMIQESKIGISLYNNNLMIN